MEAVNMAWPPDERPHYEQTLAALTDRLSPDELAGARGRGASMSEQAAIDFALGRA